MKAPPRALSIVLAVAALGTACAGGPTTPADGHPDLRTSVLPTATWERVIRPGFGRPPGFSFALPPGFEQLDLQPIDSDAATYVRGDARLHYDFGFYTGAPAAEGPNAVEQRIRIGGRVARVVAYDAPAGRRIVVAWWEGVRGSTAGGVHLLIRAEFAAATDRAELLASIYSVTFP